MRKNIRKLIIAAFLLLLLAAGLYQLPPIKSRLEWRITVWTENIRRRINPPENVVFLPSNPGNPQATEIALQVAATLRAFQESTALPTLLPTIEDITPTPSTTSTPTEAPPPTITPTLLPASVSLTGIRHEYETWNNCGPATIGMQLSFWGWNGNQAVTAAYLKPNPRDKNVSPHELAAYVENETAFRVIFRPGGTLQTLKGLIAAGFPTIVEKTLDLQGVDGWIGHYALLSGYDEGTQRFFSYDSYVQANLPEGYDKLDEAWRSFNYTFLVVYPPEREEEVFAILGSLADEKKANETALEKAEEEIDTQSGLANFFAWFNKGSALSGLGDHFGAAAAFDTAFFVYSQLPNEERPWRMVWYQHGPYISYFETGRYQDVVDLADTTLSTMGEQTVEETFFWRGLAYEQLGRADLAKADLSLAVALNSNYSEARAELERLGNP